jgi:hypothetical protein
MITSEFMVQVLRGEKHTFKIDEIETIHIPINRYTSKVRLEKLAKLNPDLMMYLPCDPKIQCDRQFLIDIINTFDPAFFRGAIAEINSHIMSRASDRN